MENVAVADVGTATEAAPLSRRDALAYSLSSAGLSAPFFFTQFYFLNFATDVLLVAPGVIGAWIVASRIWDAVSDPIVGSWSDLTRTRLGRRRPWILASAPAVALSFGLLWCPPNALTAGQQPWWLGLSLLCFMTATTAWAIPHQAWGTELSQSSKHRTRLFGLRQACSMLGVAAAFAAMQFVANAPSPREAASQIALTAGVVIATVLVVPALLLREPHQLAPPRAQRVTREVVALLADPGTRRLMGARLAATIAAGTQGTIAPYLAIYVLKRPDLIGILPVFYIVPLIASIPLWVSVARRIGRARTWCASMLGGALAYSALFWIRADDLIVAVLLIALVGLASGSAGPIGPSLLADLIDRDATRARQRRDGIYFAVWEFTEKTAGAIVVLVVAVALQVSGFEPNTDQHEPAELAIRGCLSVFPASMFVIATALLSGLRAEEGESIAP